jgi:hypothetical protein
LRRRPARARRGGGAPVTRGRWVAVALAVALLVVGARTVAAAIVEQRWYAEFGDGRPALWRARAASLAVLRGLAALVGTAYVYANLLGVVSTVDTVVLPRRVGGLDIIERVPGAQLRWICFAVAALLGALLALPLDGWQHVDALVAGRGLGEIEPYTGRDLSFFVHWLPVENAAYAWALLTLVVTGALVLGLYALTPGLRWTGGRPRSPAACAGTSPCSASACSCCSRGGTGSTATRCSPAGPTPAPASARSTSSARCRRASRSACSRRWRRSSCCAPGGSDSRGSRSGR